MALLNCEECGKQVSDKATACPNCGAPLGAAAGQVPTPSKTAAKISIWLILLGSCLGLGFIGWIGSIGYPVVILGIFGIGGGIALIVKGPAKFKTTAIVGTVASVLLVFFGAINGSMKAATAAKAAAQAEAARKTAEENKAALMAATAKLASLSPDADANTVIAVCEQADGLGGISTEHRERCGAAYLARGQALVGEEKYEEASQALKKASQVSSAELKDSVTAALVVAEYNAGTAGAKEDIKVSEAKYAAKEYVNAASLATQAQKNIQRALLVKPDDAKAKGLAARIYAHSKRAQAAAAAENKRVEEAKEKASRNERRKNYIKESCREVAHKFGPGSSLSDLQKEELWKRYSDQKFVWDMEVVEVSSAMLESGYSVQWKCKGSESFIQDVQMGYDEKDRNYVMQLKKGYIYEVEGKLKHSFTLLGITADPL